MLGSTHSTLTLIRHDVRRCLLIRLWPHIYVHTQDTHTFAQCTRYIYLYAYAYVFIYNYIDGLNGALYLSTYFCVLYMYFPSCASLCPVANDMCLWASPGSLPPRSSPCHPCQALPCDSHSALRQRVARKKEDEQIVNTFKVRMYVRTYPHSTT